MNHVLKLGLALLVLTTLTNCGNQTTATPAADEPATVTALPTNADGTPVPGENALYSDEEKGRGAHTRLGGGQCQATCQKTKKGITYYSSRVGTCGGGAFANCCASLDYAYGTGAKKCYPL